MVDYTNLTASDLVDGNNVSVNWSHPPAAPSRSAREPSPARPRTDAAGNKAKESFEESFKVSVAYTWSGTLQPINGESTADFFRSSSSPFSAYGRAAFPL